MKNLQTNTVIPILVTILVTLIIFLPFGPTWVTNTTAPVREKVIGAMRQVGQYWTWIGDVRELSKQQADLAAERNNLLAKLVKLEAVERENIALRQQLSMGKKVDQRLIMVKSAGIIESGGEKYLLINSGSNNGIKVGQVALANQVLVGKVKQVNKHSSLIEMPQTANSIIPVVIRYEEGLTKGVVKANFNLTARIDQVLPDERLQKGDTILTSGEGGTYPADIVVGKVGVIEKSDQQLFQSASISIPWEISEIETIFIVEQQ
jgi:rod shape-determining protein MreC